MDKNYVFLNFESIGLDVNGNSCVVTPATSLLTVEEINGNISTGGKWETLYKIAIKRANSIGGKKYNTKNHPNHVRFQSTSKGRDIEKLINEKIKDWAKPIIKYGSIQDGSRIKFKPQYGTSEVFTVSQWDGGHKGWAGDKNGSGWYFYNYQVLVRSGGNWLPVKSDDEDSEE